MKKIRSVVLGLLFLSLIGARYAAFADDTLQGYIKRDDAANTQQPGPTGDRSAGNGSSAGGAGITPGSAPHHRRVARLGAHTEKTDDQTNVADLNDFRLDAASSSDGAESGRSLIPRKIFDLGVDANSKELVLAWEKWHKQISGSLYYRTWRRLAGASTSGSATLDIEVTKSGQLTANVIDQSGSPLVEQAYLDAANSLNGNPGLAFPTGSQRDAVSFTYTYKLSPFVHPGYDWKKNDFETIRDK